ncbi:hypothetical protein E4U60_003969 [Claviceps pazoutovae]|uniref:Carbohydrate-binding module family 19 domain-containing protein n=1 Tax=Claviceps pazoutovae TaxID=1649127 RepID=A0A9P7SFS1_9HYPO|nr:hypothetical protein E4U60_003969 [Claviceps pazoutovae]
MRHHAQVAAVACLFLCSQTVEAGPLNWRAAAAADVYVARREDHPLTDDAPAMMDPNSIPRILLPMLPSTDMSTSVSATAAGTVKAELAGTYSGPLSLVIAPLPTPTSTPGLDTARDGHTEAVTAIVPATSMTGLLSSAVSASSTQPLIVGIFPTELTSAAGSTELPQGTDGAVVLTPSGGGLTDVGADPPLSTFVSGDNGTLPTAVVSSTTSDNVPSTTSANASPTTPTIVLPTTPDNTSPTIFDSVCPTILGNVPLTTPDNVLSTTSDNGSPTNSESISSTISAEAIYSPIKSNNQLPTSPDVSPPYLVPGSTTEPAATDRIPSPTAGNTSTTLLSTADQNTAPIPLPTDGLLATKTCETAQITSSLSPTQAAPTIPVPQESSAMTPPILNPAAQNSTSSSTSTPTSAEFPSATSFEPTSTTTAADMPTATSSVEPVIYSHNLAQAKNLNKVYSNLTDHSPCSGTQTACIGGKTAKCIDGAFVFTDCPAAQRCYALPRTDNRGTRNACVDPVEANRILGPDTAGAEDGTTSTGSAPTDPVPSTFRTETKRTTLTYTRVIVVTDMSSGPETEVPTEPTAPPEGHGNTFIAVTSMVPSETGGMTSITLVSSSASAYSSPFSSSVSSSSSSPSEPSLLSPSSPTPSPTPSPSEPEPSEPEPSETEPSSEPSSPAEPSPSPSSSPSSSPPPLASSSSSSSPSPPSPSPPLPSPPSPLIPSSPTPRPTTTPLPDPTTTNQPSFIVVIQTFGTPTQFNLTTTSTATSTTPGRLVLIPVELSSLPSLPAIAGITTTPPIPTASPIGSIHLASGHAGPAGPESGSPHTTVTSNGTPTVSVYFTVTVTQKEKEMVTMKEKKTVTVTVTTMPT